MKSYAVGCGIASIISIILTFTFVTCLNIAAENQVINSKLLFCYIPSQFTRIPKKIVRFIDCEASSWNLCWSKILPGMMQEIQMILPPESPSKLQLNCILFLRFAIELTSTTAKLIVQIIYIELSWVLHLMPLKNLNQCFKNNQF